MIIGIDASRAFIEDKTGTENYSYELIKAILKLPEAKEHQFRLYTKDKVKVDEEIMDLSNVDLVEISWKRLWTQGGLALECLRRPPDVLFVPAHTLPILRPRGLKTVVTIHGLEYEYLPEYYKFPQKLLLNRSTEFAVRYASKLIAVSSWTKSQLVDRLGAKKNKIEVVHEGIGERFLKAKEQKFSSEYMRQIRYKYSLPKDYILFLGTIQPRKNLVRLIEAFSMVLTEGKPPFLAIAGKKGWMHDEIYEAPKKFGVSSRVKFIGRVAEADIAAVYKGAKLFVWPSLMEGFGLPVLEAMQMGVPVITSNRGALPEVVGEAGLQIDPENVLELADAISLVLKSQELRQGLVEKGYKQVNKFSWKRAAKESLKVLTTV